MVAGQSRSTCSRVSDLVAGGVCIDHANVWELFEGHLLACGEHGCIHLRQGHTVAYHIDDVHGFRLFFFFLFLVACRHHAKHDEGEKG